MQAFSLRKLLLPAYLCLVVEHGTHRQRHRQSAQFKGSPLFWINTPKIRPKFAHNLAMNHRSVILRLAPLLQDLCIQLCSPIRLTGASP